MRIVRGGFAPKRFWAFRSIAVRLDLTYSVCRQYHFLASNMKESELICATTGVANTPNIGGKEATQKTYRGSETEKGSWIARSAIALNALAAFSVGMLFAAVYPAKGSDASPLVQIPQDEAPHHDETEWWYFSGHLRGFDISGKPHSYGYELVFFQFNFPNQPLPIYQGNMAITDLTGGSFHYEQKIMAQAIPDEKNGFSLKISSWRMEGRSCADSLAAKFSDGSPEFRMTEARETR